MINFNGQDIITETEGVIEEFQQGVMNRKKEFFENARGDGEGVKYFNKPGTTHSVTFVFMNVPAASVGTIETRVLAYADYPHIGTLSIPTESFSADNCVVDNVNYTGKQYRIANIGSDLSFDEVYELTF